MIRRFLVAERSVICSKMFPSGKGQQGLNDTHSLRVIPALSGDAGVTKYELPIIKESKSYTFTEFAANSTVKKHSHDEGQLRIITRGVFTIEADGQTFEDLEEADWIYIPKDVIYSITTSSGGAMVVPYGMACDCSNGS